MYGIESVAASLSRARTPSEYRLYSVLAAAVAMAASQGLPLPGSAPLEDVLARLFVLCGAFVCRTPRRHLGDTRDRPLSASSFTSTSQHSSARPRFHTRSLSSSGLAGTRSWPAERKSQFEWRQYISVRIEVSFCSLCACACLLGRSSRIILVLLR